MDEKWYWVAFSYLGLSSKVLLKLWNSCGSLETAWFLSDNQLAWRLKQYEVMADTLNTVVSRKIGPSSLRERLDQKQIQIIPIYDQAYPPQLKHLGAPPALIYVLGNLAPLYQTSISVVGTRKCSDYGIRSTELVVAELVQAGLVVVSGLAHGIDSVAHRATLEHDGTTIAVLGFGLNRLANFRRPFIKKILQAGAIISEYPPEFPGEDYTFIERNRIIAALSSGTLVGQAPIKSGALYTAEMALDLGREVWAIPGPIDQPQSAGTNRLIKKDGAHFITGASDILEYYKEHHGIKTQGNTARAWLTPAEEKIYRQLALEAASLEQLAEKCQQPSHEILSTISLLEIKGIIRRLNGVFTLTPK